MMHAGFVPDSTTVFHRKGDVISLGELVLPADAHLRINASQVLVVAPEGATGSEHSLLAPYAAAQAHLDGLMARVINSPVVVAGDNQTDTGEAQRSASAGVRWQLPPHKAPSGWGGSVFWPTPRHIAACLYVCRHMCARGKLPSMHQQHARMSHKQTRHTHTHTQTQFRTAFYATESELLMNVSRLGIQTIAGNASAEAASMYIRQPAATLSSLQNTLYDQLEV